MKKENFTFEKYLIENLDCEYSEYHDNRLDHDNGYYIFIDGDRFMVFDLADESGWIGKVPIEVDDPVIDDYFKEILSVQKEFEDDIIDYKVKLLNYLTRH